MMNIVDVLVAKYVGKQWSIIEDNYETLEWLDESPKPSFEELVSLIPVVEEEKQQREEQKVIQRNEIINKRNELLTRLGISQEELRILFAVDLPTE
jgi:hypothetical protein